MTRYTPLPRNRKVIDVLCCVVAGYGNVKQIVKILKQKQPTISTKLQFLRKNKVVIKDKWNYKPNWKELYKILYKILKEQISIHLVSSQEAEATRGFKRMKKQNKAINKILRNIEFYFPEQFLKNFLISSYAWLYLDRFPKYSLYELISEFLDGLVIEDDKAIKSKFKNLVEVRSALKPHRIPNDLWFFTMTASDCRDLYNEEVRKDIERRMQEVIR